MKNDADRVRSEVARRRTRGWTEVIAGAALVVAGLLFTRKVNTLEMYFAASAPIIIGFIAGLRGTLRLLSVDAGLLKPTQQTAKTHGSLNLGFGFKSFVAWRYLMARDHRVSRIVLGVLFLAIFISVIAYTAQTTLITVENPLGLERDSMLTLASAILIAKVIGSVLIYFALLIGALRFIFSFFTTVPLVGVWIGTGALVCVLAVMSGFETDLREKILGSNAHIQVTREEGEFTNWRDIKAKIDKMPGVLASSPYAVSEVVIAANNNGMNVIIKGIDPATIGKVTDLVNNLKDKDAIKRLEPLVDDTRDLTVPDKPQPGSGVTDPPPPDMPGVGEPIDFSQPADGAADPSGAIDPDQPPSIDDLGPPGPPPPPLDDTPPPLPTDTTGSAAPTPSTDPKPLKRATDDPSVATKPAPKRDEPAGDPDRMPVSPYGGDANDVQKPVLDPPPADLVTTDEAPQDFSGGEDDDSIHVIDVPMEPSLSRRTQSLPGILVGAELVKQTHLYTGEEVRIVSPLSDPANPDATGTPIPFNRDYRVAGIFYTGMYEYDLKYVYVTLDSLTDFLDRGDVVDGIEIRIGDPDETDAYVGRLRTLLGPKYRIQDWKELNRSLFSALKLEKIAMFLVLGIVILVASFSIVGNLIMVVVEKGREIALLKTLGASDLNVMLVFAIQGLLIGVIGTMLGLGTGLLACWFGKEYGIPLNPDVYYIDRMPVHVDMTSVLLTGAAGILISMFATFYPALVAARVRPAAGMRH
jgi:lipoprotein-releasing system permease protein